MILVMGGAHSRRNAEEVLLQVRDGSGYQFVKQKGPFDPGAADPSLQLKFCCLAKAWTGGWSGELKAASAQARQNL